MDNKVSHGEGGGRLEHASQRALGRRWRRCASRHYELLAATAEALTDLRSACRRQGPPRTAPSAASRRRPRAPWCPAPARPPPSRPIVAFSLGLGALKRGSQDHPIKTSTLHTGLSLSLLQREFRCFGCVLYKRKHVFYCLRTDGWVKRSLDASDSLELERLKSQSLHPESR